MQYRRYLGDKEIKEIYVGDKSVDEIWCGNTLFWKKNTAQRHRKAYYAVFLCSAPNGVLVMSLGGDRHVVGPFSEDTLEIDIQFTLADRINSGRRSEYGILVCDDGFYVYEFTSSLSLYSPITLTNLYKMSTNGKLVSKCEINYAFNHPDYENQLIMTAFVLNGSFYITVHYRNDGDYTTGIYTTYIFDSKGNCIESYSDVGNEDYFDNHALSTWASGYIGTTAYVFGHYTYKVVAQKVTRVISSSDYYYIGYYNGDRLFQRVQSDHIGYDKVQIYVYDGNTLTLAVDLSDRPQIETIHYIASSANDRAVSVYGTKIYFAHFDGDKIKVRSAEGLSNLVKDTIVYEADRSDDLRFMAIYARETKLYVLYEQKDKYTSVIDVVDLN